MRTIEAALAGPVVALALIAAAALAATAAGLQPLWPGDELTLAEAALLRDDGDVARLVGLAQDPNERYVVRRNLIDRSAHEMTPLEAAVHAARPEMVRLLLALGARPDAGTAALVACEPVTGALAEIQAMLSRFIPPAPCPPTAGADPRPASR
jgi:hypothetical protein